jgi:hypothetical protein
VSSGGNDILSAGDEQRRSPLTIRRRKQIALFLVGTLVAYAGWRRLAGVDEASPNSKSLPQAAAAASSGSPSASLLAERATPPPPDDVLPMGEPTGARLVLGGIRLVDLNVDTGDVTDTIYRGRVRQTLHVRGGDVVLMARTGKRAAAAASLPARRDSSIALGQATALVPAADDAHVWLADPAAPAVVRKIDLKGRVEATVNLGAWRVAIRETAYGMVTTSSVRFSSSLELWDITSGRVVRTDWVAENFVVAAADAEHTAFTLPFCDLPMCPVKVAVTRTGEVFDAVMPLGWATSKAAFSPDGKTLAVIGRQVTRNAEDEPALLVTDLASGRSRRASGVEPGQYRAGLAWSPDSRWVFAVADVSTTPLLGYRLGDRRVRYIPLPRRARDLDPAAVTSVSAY